MLKCWTLATMKPTASNWILHNNIKNVCYHYNRWIIRFDRICLNCLSLSLNISLPIWMKSQSNYIYTYISCNLPHSTHFPKKKQQKSIISINFLQQNCDFMYQWMNYLILLETLIFFSKIISYLILISLVYYFQIDISEVSWIHSDCSENCAISPGKVTEFIESNHLDSISMLQSY